MVLAYFAASLRQLPGAYRTLDTNRLTLVHFCVHALDLLGVWEDTDLQTSLGLNRHAIIEWIYSLQTTTAATNEGSDVYPEHVGFKGGSFLGGSQGSVEAGFHATTAPPALYNHGHIAMTYTALCTLQVLGDDWSRVDRNGIVQALSSLQLPNGSFQSIAVGSEHDLRFLYCACCISYLLNDWRGVDIKRAVDYIRSCRSWDPHFVQSPVWCS